MQSDDKLGAYRVRPDGLIQGPWEDLPESLPPLPRPPRSADDLPDAALVGRRYIARLLGVMESTVEAWGPLLPEYRLPNGSRRIRMGDVRRLIEKSLVLEKGKDPWVRTRSWPRR
jgi:hypothetical protein